MDEIDRLLARVQRETYGKLTLPTYRRLHDSAAASGGGTFVEIGTAQGAATIALALGAAAAGHDFRIVTLDGFVAGSRPRARTIEEKAAIARRGFEKFGVSDRIDLVVGEAAELVATADPRDVSLILLDADGRIDRDLALLWDRMRPDCAVVIDDVDDANYIYVRNRRLRIDQKHRLTHGLIEAFVAAGLLIPDGAAGQTGWFRKGPAATGAAGIEALALPVYRGLVFAEVGPGALSLKRALYGLAAARAPWLARAWHRLRKR